jgi:autotransporter-associated beta strand protein
VIDRDFTASALVFLLLVAICAGATRDAGATTYYWDTNGATAGSGSAGGAAANWLSNSWAASPGGTAVTGPWPNTQPDNDDGAVFAGTAGTVNLDADVYANALIFQTHNYAVASTGGALHLVGTNPTITVNLPASNNTATISAPITADDGFTLAGNSAGNSNKFLVLANMGTTAPNSFAGTLTISAGGALRLGGGVANEQIPDDVDLAVSGVIDFITSGGASDGKQEKVRNVIVTGPNANFSIGNEADFVVNSISASSTGSGQGIAINGNFGFVTDPHVPGRLIINGWSDGAGHLTLDDGRVQMNVTSASTAVGGRILLSGNIYSSGNSQIYNNNGGTTPDDNHFDNKALDFTAAAHTIDVADGTLAMTSRTATQPVDVTSTNPGGTTLTKTGPGVWLYEHAVQTSFSGTNRVEEGTLRIGASERLANGSNLEIAGGVFDLQGFSERVNIVTLESGSITGTGAANLVGTHFNAYSGVVNVGLDGGARLAKSTGGTVELNGVNTYSGTTTISDGTLLVNGAHMGSAGFQVGENGTLGGVGTIDTEVDVEGTLAPGTSVGTLTVNDAVTFDAGSHFAVELSGAAADKLVAKDLNLAASEFLDVSVLSPLAGDSWLIAEYSGTLTGAFDNVAAGYAVDYDTPGEIYLRLGVPGDYNANGTIDLGDYTVWRNTLDDVVPPGTGADGSGPGGTPDGLVDGLDYDFWKAHFGDTSPGGGAGATAQPVPERSAASLACVAVGCILGTATRRRRTLNLRADYTTEGSASLTPYFSKSR